MVDKKNISFVTPAILPDGDGNWTLCPELLTEAEAIRYLRLDTIGHNKPGLTLKYYRECRKLKSTRIGKKLFYSRKALDEFIENMTDFHNCGK